MLKHSKLLLLAGILIGILSIFFVKILFSWEDFYHFTGYDNLPDFISAKTEPRSARPLADIRQASRGMGPLKRHSTNPRYFANADGQAVFLTGSHTWCNFHDCKDTEHSQDFDYKAFLEMLILHNHNFFRLWRAENYKSGENVWINRFRAEPSPYMRIKIENTVDDHLQFDLDQFNPDYFDRLRSRVLEAQEKDIYVSIMLFNGFSIEAKNERHNPWPGHPYNGNNNVNGINGDSNNNGQGEEIHQLSAIKVNKIIALQEDYVRKVIDTVNDLDNVLYEISNESTIDSHDWQYHMINFINRYQSTLPKQHPVGMTVAYPNGDNSVLKDSPADWISPSRVVEIEGDKVVIYDTDHLCGICGKRQWIWESLTTGANWIYMDPYNGIVLGPSYIPDIARDVDVRRNMGFALTYANRIGLGSMVAQPNLCSSNYCLAGSTADGFRILTYIPKGGEIIIDLSKSSGKMRLEWFNPASGNVMDGGIVMGGKSQNRFSAPFIAKDAVLYVYETGDEDQ